MIQNKRMSKKVQNDLDRMLEELKNCPSVYQPSMFWTLLNQVHAEYLTKEGLTNFKRSVNSKYFNWGALGIIVHQLSPILNAIIKGNLSPIILSKLNDDPATGQSKGQKLNFLRAFLYKTYVSSLFEYIAKNDSLDILNKLEEPLLGHPLAVSYKGKLISQDLCNSIHEFYSLTTGINLPKKARIAELGAGYGRLGYVLLNEIPDSTYCIIDIPPALFIAQNYLPKVFKKEKIFRFRPFKSFKEVRKEFEGSRIQFLMPHQLELLPKKYFDLFINISSLHEMTRLQIGNYIEQIDKACKGYFYTKQWRKSRTRDNEFIREEEYPIPKRWKIISKRSRHPIQKMFFDALYMIR